VVGKSIKPMSRSIPSNSINGIQPMKQLLIEKSTFERIETRTKSEHFEKMSHNRFAGKIFDADLEQNFGKRPNSPSHP